jgi:hypothetical protein
VGVDLGQKYDYTALAVVEAQWRDFDGRREDVYLARFLERLPLGTPYPQVAARVQAVIANIRRQAPAAGIRLYVDATGVGQPVVDLLKHAGVPVRPVFFTHGDRRTPQADGTISLGKAWLVSRLQALLQTGRILLPKTMEARTLAQELLDYEIHVDEKANDTYGAFKVGSHDDLVTALGLAVQPPKDHGVLPSSAPAVEPSGQPSYNPRRRERDPLDVLRSFL